MNKWILLAVLFFSTHAFGWTLYTGTYELKSGTQYGSKTHLGEVVIAPQGENYKVIWRTGNGQTQIGTGILQDNILSIAFSDVSNPHFWGVASYRVKWNGELEGRWTAADGQTQTVDYLYWKSYSTY
jgi:hypothetical protein